MRFLEIGLKMRLFRKEHGYTQKDLAKLLGVTKQSISSYERGKSQPSMATIIEFSDISGYSISELVAIEEKIYYLRAPDTHITSTLSSFRTVAGEHYVPWHDDGTNSTLKSILDNIENDHDFDVFK